MADENWAEWAQHKADELITHGVGSHLIGEAVTALIVLAALHHRYSRSLKDILKGQFSGVNVDITEYVPTGEINPDTGNEFYNQKIDMLHQTQLEEIFNPEFYKPLLKLIENAEKKAKADAEGRVSAYEKFIPFHLRAALQYYLPSAHYALEDRFEPSKTDPKSIVYMYLPDLVAEEDWSALKEAIQRLTKGYFAKLFNDAEDAVSLDPDPRVVPVYQVVLPLLVVEQTSGGRYQSKITLIKVPKDKRLTLPDKADVKFEDASVEDFGRTYKANPSLPHADRYDLLERIFADLKKPEFAWLKNFDVDVRTTVHEKFEDPLTPER